MDGLSIETLQQIQKTAVEASGAKGKVEILALPDEPKGTYGIVTASGTVDVAQAAPGPRKIVLNSVDQVPTFIGFAKSKLGGEPSIYYNESYVYVILDDGPESQRKDFACIKLQMTDEYKTVQGLKDWNLDQKDFISLLRVRLADCTTPEVTQLINACKAIGFSSQTKESREVGHGRESMGFDIQDEVQSKAGEIPEEVVLDVRIFDDRELEQRHKITCIVEICAKAGTFKLTPKPADLRKEMQREMDFLQGALTAGADGCPVYFGSPWA